MTNKKPDGGSAFPHPDTVQWTGSTAAFGLTKREYFAIKTLQGYLASRKSSEFLYCDAIDASIRAADYMINQLKETA